MTRISKAKLKSKALSKIPLVGLLLIFACTSFLFTRKTYLPETEPDGGSASGNSGSAWVAASSDKWLCTLPPLEEARAKPRTPVAIMSDARTGSNFFFGLLQIFNQLTNNNNFDLLPLYEAFNKDKGEENLLGVRLVADAISSCHLSYHQNQAPNVFENFLVNEKSFRNIDDTYAFLKGEMKANEWEIVKPLLEAAKGRFDDPMHFVKTVTRIPKQAEKAYFVMKIFPVQFDDMHKTTAEFITSMNQLKLQGNTKPQFMVTYRRRVIEMFVSFKIAEARGKWIDAKATKADAITLIQRQADYNIKQKTKYFKDIRSSLEENKINYEVFEYFRDLKEPDVQMKTVRRLKNSMHVPIGDEKLTETNFLSKNLKKQAQAPLSDLVANWNEVIEWGYAGEVNEWEDLFPGK
jgi:hypothetical protein